MAGLNKSATEVPPPNEGDFSQVSYENKTATGFTNTSWAALVKTSPSSRYKLNYVQNISKDGSNVVRMPKSLAVEGIKKWKNTLVGYFIGKAAILLS